MNRLILGLAFAAMSLVKATPAATLEEMNAQFEKQKEERRTHPKPGFQATTITPVSMSMTDLLNSGWVIAGGAWGVGFTLRKDNKWLVCEVDDGRMSGSLPGSRCEVLN